MYYQILIGFVRMARSFLGMIVSLRLGKLSTKRVGLKTLPPEAFQQITFKTSTANIPPSRWDLTPEVGLIVYESWDGRLKRN
jgi:hypothetical protein